MARTATLLELRTRARQRGDFVNSQFITDAELTGFVNDSIAELFDLLVQEFGNDYYVSTQEIPIVTGTLEYDLPTDFYKLLGVDLLDGPNGSQPTTLRPFMFVERNRSDASDSIYRYRIVGSKINLVDSNIGGTLKLWYIPHSTVLVADTDTFDGINGYEEYIVIDAAIKMREKEESDTAPLERAKAALKRRIEEAADNRDAGQSERVTDVREEEMYSTNLFYEY